MDKPPVLLIGGIAAAGIAYIVYKNMQANPAANTPTQATTTSTAGVDSAILVQNFDSMRIQLYDQINSILAPVLQTKTQPPTPGGA